MAGLLAGFRDWWGRDEPPEESLAAGVRRLMTEDAEYLLAAQAEGAAPAGVCQLRYRPVLWRDGDDCFLEDLFVREEARRAGLGRSLVDAAVQRARERGCARIELDANDANPPAVTLYEGAGFEAWSEPPGGRNLLFRRHL